MFNSSYGDAVVSYFCDYCLFFLSEMQQNAGSEYSFPGSKIKGQDAGDCTVSIS